MLFNSHHFKKFTQWLLPHCCILCGCFTLSNRDLCDDCCDDLPRLHHACAICARPLTSFKSKFACDFCLTNPSLPFDKTYALYFYQKPVTRLIMDLKFGGALTNAVILGELLADRIQREWYLNQPLPDIILPVPLHPNRLKERGYNQALEIARPIAHKLQIPINHSLCQRVKHTSAQATLQAKAREDNIKNAFRLTRSLEYQHIAVIDDVITTGGTMIEICKILKESGARRIDVWCCARPDSAHK